MNDLTQEITDPIGWAGVDSGRLMVVDPDSALAPEFRTDGGMQVANLVQTIEVPEGAPVRVHHFSRFGVERCQYEFMGDLISWEFAENGNPVAWKRLEESYGGISCICPVTELVATRGRLWVTDPRYVFKNEPAPHMEGLDGEHYDGSPIGEAAVGLANITGDGMFHVEYVLDEDGNRVGAFVCMIPHSSGAFDEEGFCVDRWGLRDMIQMPEGLPVQGLVEHAWFKIATVLPYEFDLLERYGLVARVTQWGTKVEQS